MTRTSHLVTTATAVALVAVCALTGCTAAEPTSQASRGPGAGSASPTGAAESVSVSRRDFQIRYRLEGATADSSAVGLVSHPKLQLVPSLKDGDSVAKGAVVGTLRIDPQIRADLEAASSSSRIEKDRLAALSGLEGTVRAPVSGTFSAGPASIDLAGIDVVVDLTPIQALRYSSLTFSGRATVETVTGQREVPCAAVWIAQVAGTTDATSTASASTTRLHCRLPEYIETAAGLPATVALTSQKLANAIVVPNVYVGYDAATDGYVVTLDQSGATTTVPVEVGVTDGVVRVISTDLPIGAKLVLPSGGSG